MFKKNKYYGKDTDKDMLDDGYEVDISRHNSQNKPYHPIKSINIGNKVYTRNGISGIHHDSIDNRIIPVGSKKHAGKLTVKMKQPNIKGLDMKNIKMPKMTMKESKKTITSLDDDYINFRLNHLNKFLRKRKK